MNPNPIEELDQLLSTIKNCSSELKEIEGKYRYDQNDKPHDFGFFDVLTNHHRENLHTNLIRVLLNPKGAHQQGDYFLKEFTNILLAEYQEAKIKGKILEEAIIENKDKHAFEYGRMDIFLKIGDYALVIENKIFAPEGVNQLERYSAYCKDEYKENYDLFYLTPYGVRSADHLTFDGYRPLSYNTHIQNWLRNCLKNDKLTPQTRFVIESYLTLLNKSVLTMTEDERTDEIAEMLLNYENRQIVRHLYQLSQAQLSVRNKLRTRFFLEVHEKLKEIGPFIPHHSRSQRIEPNVIWDEMYRGFILEEPDDSSFYTLKTSEGVLKFAIEHDWGNIYFGIAFIPGTGLLLSENFWTVHPFVNLERIFKRNYTQSKELQIIHEKGWFLKRFSNIVNPSTLGSDALNHRFNEEGHELVKKLMAEIRQYLEAWSKTLREFRQTEN